MNWLSLIGLFIKYGPVLEQLWNAVTSNEDYVTKVESLLPQVAQYAVQIAQEFFPNAAPAVQKIAGTALTFNTQLVKYAQQACNLLLTPSPNLAVDGMYGPHTHAAVKTLQQQLGLTADGVFGKLTQAAVAKALPGLSL